MLGARLAPGKSVMAAALVSRGVRSRSSARSAAPVLGFAGSRGARWGQSGTLVGLSVLAGFYVEYPPRLGPRVECGIRRRKGVDFRVPEGTLRCAGKGAVCAAVIPWAGCSGEFGGLAGPVPGTRPEVAWGFPGAWVGGSRAASGEGRLDGCEGISSERTSRLKTLGRSGSLESESAGDE